MKKVSKDRKHYRKKKKDKEKDFHQKTQKDCKKGPKVVRKEMKSISQVAFDKLKELSYSSLNNQSSLPPSY